MQAERDNIHFNQPIRQPIHSSYEEKKRKEKTGFFGVNLMRNAVLYRAAEVQFMSFMQVTMTPERIREMKATFKECDTDGSGDVGRSEFVEGIQNAGMHDLPFCTTRVDCANQCSCLLCNADLYNNLL